MLPEDYLRYVLSWLRYIRRVSIPTKEQLQARGTYPPMSLSANRFAPNMIFNFDETPIPFEFADDMTYEMIGEKTVSTNSERSGWEKRQCTIVIYICADGLDRGLKVKVIFKGISTKEGGEIHAKESHLYDQRVTVEYNEKAWNNGDLTLDWAVKEFLPIIQPTADNPALLAMDCASFHKTPALLELLRTNHVVTAMVPPGCTGILQPLDTAVNKTFKAKMTQLSEEYISEMEAASPKMKWTVSMKRVQTTRNVADAWEWLCREKSEMVAKSFIDVGLNLPTDGSEDHLLSIKGQGHGRPEIGAFHIPDEDIEDYQLAHQRMPEISETGDYILADGKPLRNYSWLSNSQLSDALRTRGIPGIGKAKAVMIAALKADDLTTKPGCSQMRVGDYVHQGGNERAFVDSQFQWQIQGYKHAIFGEIDSWESSEDEGDEV